MGSGVCSPAICRARWLHLVAAACDAAELCFVGRLVITCGADAIRRAAVIARWRVACGMCGFGGSMDANCGGRSAGEDEGGTGVPCPISLPFPVEKRTK